MLYIAVELGGTHLRYGVVDSAFQVVKFATIGSALFSAAHDKIGFIQKLVEPLMQEYGNIRAVTMALSSSLDKTRAYVFSSPMLRGFDNIALKAELEARLGVPLVLEKDVNILLLYEIYTRKIDTRGIIAGFFLGTGLGNAISVNGEVYAGSTGSAGELGHIPVANFAKRCGCGKAGCIELQASGRVLETLAREVFGCPVEQIFALHQHAPEVQNVIEYYALAIATEIGILDPQYVIIGGGVSQMVDFPRQSMIQRVQENLRSPFPRDSLEIIFASADREAGLVGAAIHAHNTNNGRMQ